MSTSGPSPEHDRLLRSALAEMRRQGMTDIHADHLPNYVQPNPVGGFIPDATAHHQATICLAECEISESLASSHTEQQWRAFIQHVNTHGGYFIPVVSVADKNAAESLIRRITTDMTRIVVWAF